MLYEDNDIIDFLKKRFSCLTEGQKERCQYYPRLWEEDEEGYGYSFPCEDDSWEGFQDICDTIGAIDFASGASKIVFFFEEIPNFVVKIPFRGERCYNSETWDVLEDSTSAYRFALFDNGNDYCAAEEELFEYAFDYGVQDFLAETRFACWVDDIRIYLAEKCDKEYNYMRNKASENSLDKAKEIGRNYDIDTNCLACMIDEYNARIFSFINFIQDMNISDLHSGNFGYIDDRIVVFDYSGYDEY